MQRIVRIVLIVVVAVAGVFAYVHWSKTRALTSGAIHVRPQQEAATAGAAGSPPEPAKDQTANPQSDPSQGSPQGAQRSVYTLPASDTISRNPPDRTILAGSGRYELYRQGDITWRMDTATGQACVLFASEAMWRKTLVYQHGCGVS